MSTLADKVGRLTKDLEAARLELEGYQVAFHDDEALKNEVRVLREFIEDVRLGIRDLSEYRDVCGLTYP